MTIHISSVGLDIPGKVTRKHNADTDTTTLTLDEAQLRAVVESGAKALRYFDGEHADHDHAQIPGPAVSQLANITKAEGVSGLVDKD